MINWKIGYLSTRGYIGKIAIFEITPDNKLYTTLPCFIQYTSYGIQKPIGENKDIQILKNKAEKTFIRWLNYTGLEFKDV